MHRNLKYETHLIMQDVALWWHIISCQVEFDHNFFVKSYMLEDTKIDSKLGIWTYENTITQVYENDKFSLGYISSKSKIYWMRKMWQSINKYIWFYKKIIWLFNRSKFDHKLIINSGLISRQLVIL